MRDPHPSLMIADLVFKLDLESLGPPLLLEVVFWLEVIVRMRKVE
jgi:hypothetical protein